MSENAEGSGPASALERPKWLFWALVASLALNLVFVAGVGSAMWRHHHGKGHHRGGPDARLERFVAQLPENRRDVIRTELKSLGDSLKPLRRDIRAAKKDVDAQLATEPFDRTRVETATKKLRDAEAVFQEKLSAALTNAAEKMTAEERALFREWRHKGRKRGHRHRRDKADD